MNDSKVRVGIPLQTDGKDCCYAGKDKLCIRYDGKVFGCESFKYINLWDGDGKFIEPDSIYDRSVDAINSDSKNLKYETRLIKEQMGNCRCDEKCPVQRMFLERLSEIRR